MSYDNYFSGCLYTINTTISPGAWVLENMNAQRSTIGDKTIRYNNYTFPTLLWQMCLSVGLVLVVQFILKSFRLPGIVAQIIVGVLLGPSVLGQLDDFEIFKLVFPRSSSLRLTMVGNLGMFFFLFLMGVQCNARVIGRLGKKVLIVAISNLVVPLVVGLAACWTLGLKPDEGVDIYSFYIYITIIPSVTAFPVLARLVTDLKFINTEMGRLALYSAVITDLFAWILVSIVILIPSEGVATNHTDKKHLMRMALLFVVLSMGAFMLVCWFIVRPIIYWYCQRMPEGEQVSDQQLGLIITTAMVAGAVLDAIGLHAIFGGFVIGLMVPKGVIADSLVSRLESFAAGILLPVYFVNIGEDVDVMFVSVMGADEFATLKVIILVFIITMMVKLIGNMLVANILFSMKPVQGLALGLIMCCKGHIEMIILDVGDDKELYPLGVYSVLILACIITTMICVPVATFLSNSMYGRVNYRQRNLERIRPDAELRVMTCIHSISNVPGILTLLQLSQSSVRHSSMLVRILHLVEFVERSAATIIIQENQDENAIGQNILMDSTQSGNQYSCMVSAFRSLECNMEGISIQPQTVISPYSTMHNDIYNIAEENYTTLIILPFHKIRTTTGAMHAPIPAAREVNLNILENAPCSVAILVDRGIGVNMRFEKNNRQELHQVVVLFFGGVDDREALHYALRLAGHPRVTLTLVRFILNDEAVVRDSSSLNEKQSGMTVIPENEMERQLDDRHITEFRLKTFNDPTVIYTEINVKDGEDTIVSIKAMQDYYDLYIIGRGHSRSFSLMLSGMTDWMEFPELGCVGDFLLSSDFGSLASIFVLQQQQITR